MKKLLVAIASYGHKNDAHLARLLSEYRSMPYDTHVVVLSNVNKDLGADVEVIVGLPGRDPWSLPFAHRKVFSDRQDSYDLFLYSEDDMLITQRNIEAVLEIGKALPPQELVGFFQWEQYPDGRKFFPSVHGHFHWIPESVKNAGGYRFARYTNEHSACYLLTRDQLKRAIASGGYMVKPHEHKYDLLVTAGTDPYTQCGFTKFLCISHFEELLVAHLPNRYIGTALGQDESEFYRQLKALQRPSGPSPNVLLDAETKLFHNQWSKDYYEPVRTDLIEHVPRASRNVLSIGCGWGTTEAALVRNGCRVVAIPLDSVIAECAQSRGIETVCGDLETACSRLRGQRFDAVLMPGVLHLFARPQEALKQATSLLAEEGVLIASCPNLSRLPALWRRLLHPKRFAIDRYPRSGMHVFGRRKLTHWFTECGLDTTKIMDLSVPDQWRHKTKFADKLTARLFSLEYALIGRKRATKRVHTLAPDCRKEGATASR